MFPNPTTPTFMGRTVAPPSRLAPHREDRQPERQRAAPEHGPLRGRQPGEDAAEGWKDFVELAKTAGTPFITMDSWQLEKEELDGIIQRLSDAEFGSDEDLEDARWLRTYLGKTGFVQLGFAFQGVMMLYEAATPWYDHYQRLVEVSEDFGGIAIDGSGADDEI